MCSSRLLTYKLNLETRRVPLPPGDFRLRSRHCCQVNKLCSFVSILLWETVEVLCTVLSCHDGICCAAGQAIVQMARDRLNGLEYAMKLFLSRRTFNVRPLYMRFCCHAPLPTPPEWTVSSTEQHCLQFATLALSLCPFQRMNPKCVTLLTSVLRAGGGSAVHRRDTSSWAVPSPGVKSTRAMDTLHSTLVPRASLCHVTLRALVGASVFSASSAVDVLLERLCTSVSEPLNECTGSGALNTFCDRHTYWSC